MGNKTASNRIREIRKSKGLTQVELGGAMASDLTDSTIAKLESGTMVLTVPYMLEIAAVLGVDPLELLFERGATGARFIPVVEAGSLLQTQNWKESVAPMSDMQAIPAHIDGNNLYAVRPRHGEFEEVIGEGGYMIVNPDDCELVDGRSYVVVANSALSARRFSAKALSLAPVNSASDIAPIKIGAAPFRVLGRIVHVGYDL